MTEDCGSVVRLTRDVIQDFERGSAVPNIKKRCRKIVRKSGGGGGNFNPDPLPRSYYFPYVTFRNLSPALLAHGDAFLIFYPPFPALGRPEISLEGRNFHGGPVSSE